MRSPRRLLSLGLLLALALTGCTETPSVVRDPTSSTASGGGAVQAPADQDPAPNVDLAGAKRTAGIPDCPASGAAPVEDGLPEVIVECLGGGRDVTLSGLRGPLLINVWGSWCGPCRAEAPFLAQAGRSSTVTVLGVDYPDVPEAAVEFAGSAGWTYPQLYDADLAFRTKLQVMALPQTFFVREDGTVAGRHAGPFTSTQQLDDLSRQYLGVAP